MSQPFVGEIRMFAGNFAPAGWAFCDGQLHPIAENETLFQLIGTTYGGDGQSTFAVPDLRGRAPVHQGQGNGLSAYTLGQNGGTEQVVLTAQQIPSHTHPLVASSAAGNASSPQDAVLADGPALAYIELNPNASLAPGSVGAAGGSQPHENRPPFLVVDFIIALYGLFPQQN
jgi:microcystin-dependent protein